MVETRDDVIVEVLKAGVRFASAVAPAFSDVSFSIRRNTIFGIFGDTGCGKTTLAQCLAGFIPTDAIQGEIFLHFLSHRTVEVHQCHEFFWRKHLRGQKIVYVPQDPYKTLNPYETAEAQLQRVLALYHHPFTQAQLLQTTGLHPDVGKFFPQALSAGQKQRLMLAIALAISPELLILDEPTASIDAAGRVLLQECFAALPQRGITLVIISHEIEEYDHLLPATARFYFTANRPLTFSYHAGEKKNDPAATPLLKLEGIHKRFNHGSVLTDTSIRVGANQWIYLEGHNGSGKTTLLQIIQGLMTPEQGTLEWHGQRLAWTQVWRTTRRFVHPVFQDVFHSLDPRLTIQESLDEIIQCAPAGYRLKLHAIALELWQTFALPETLYVLRPHQLSYGQQKRVTLMRSLLKYHMERLRRPDMLHLFLFDEVFAGIHWELRERILLFLQEMRAEQKFSILWVAHGHKGLKKLCDEVYRLENGRLQLMTE